MRKVATEYAVPAMVLTLLVYSFVFRANSVMPGSGIVPEASLYVAAFEIAVQVHKPAFHIPAIDIGFGELRWLEQIKGAVHDTVGLCVPNDRPMIVLDKHYWDKASDTEKEEVLFHELGHCVLKLSHNSEVRAVDGRKRHVSLMNPYLLSAEEYAAHRAYYIKELVFPAAPNLTDPSFR